MKKIIVHNLEETQKLAQRLAEILHGGEVIALIGDLGAGKTSFTQFLAKALGVTSIVNSPTFNVIKIYNISKNKNTISKYSSSPNIFTHIDAYRLYSSEELIMMGVREHFDNSSCVTVVEWADKVKDLLPKKSIIIKIKILQNSTDRSFEITGWH